MQNDIENLKKKRDRKLHEFQMFGNLQMALENCRQSLGDEYDDEEFFVKEKQKECWRDVKRYEREIKTLEENEY